MSSSLFADPRHSFAAESQRCSHGFLFESCNGHADERRRSTVPRNSTTGVDSCHVAWLPGQLKYERASWRTSRSLPLWISMR